MTFDEIETALDQSRIEMRRPHGDWVKCRRRGPTNMHCPPHRRIPVFMENEVESTISEASAPFGYPDVRIAA